MRPIDADAALKALRKCQTYLYDARDPELKIELSSAEEAINNLPTIQPEKAQLSKEGETKDATKGATSDLISKFIDGLEEIFAHIREKHVDDSVCGLCEYDGAYIGQSGDWYNECPGFDRDDCFKLSDETRKKWTYEIIKALSTIQPEPHEGEWVLKDYLWECDKCGCRINVKNPLDCDKWNYYYCPHCGTKMLIAVQRGR